MDVLLGGSCLSGQHRTRGGRGSKNPDFGWTSFLDGPLNNSSFIQNDAEICLLSSQKLWFGHMSMRFPLNFQFQVMSGFHIQVKVPRKIKPEMPSFFWHPPTLFLLKVPNSTHSKILHKVRKSDLDCKKSGGNIRCCLENALNNTFEMSPNPDRGLAHFPQIPYAWIGFKLSLPYKRFWG